MTSINHLANDPPPPYTRRAPDVPPSRSQTFDTIQTAIQRSKHTYTLQKDPNNNNVTFIIEAGTDTLLYHAYTNSHGRIADTVLYRLDPEKSQPHQVAQSKILPFSPSPTSNEVTKPTFQINLGSTLLPPTPTWIPVQHSQNRDGLLHKTETYRFKSTSEAKPLAWQSQTSLLPSSPSSTAENTWKLLDETHVGETAYRHEFHQSVQKVIAGGGEMAVCSSSVKNGPQMRQINWNDEYGNDVEILALVVLVTILEVREREGRAKGEGSGIKGLGFVKRRLTIA